MGAVGLGRERGRGAGEASEVTRRMAGERGDGMALNIQIGRGLGLSL